MDCVFSWSGGKDSALALYKTLQNPELNVRFLLTTLSEEHRRISLHGVHQSLLTKQAASIGIPLKEVLLPRSKGLEAYSNCMQQAMNELKAEGIEAVVFGDIFLEDLRQYRENQLAQVGMKALFPLWGLPTKEVSREFIELGFQTIITCIDESKLNKSHVGQLYEQLFVDSLPAEVDVCGENGEFHSFAFDGPIFNTPIRFETGEKTRQTYTWKSNDCDGMKESAYWFIDLL